MTNRIHVRIPMKPMKCSVSNCVYIKDGICDFPKSNRGNSDAACYNIPKKKLITWLSEI